MQKIGDVTDTADGNGEFTDGNVAGNIQPTELMAVWFTTVQRELIAVLTAAKMLPDKTNDAQLVAAIKSIVADNISLQYPVGCVMWFVKNKNPNELFPGTTWLYLGENKTIRLAKEDGSDIATTGGSDSVSLSVENLPAHGHTFSANTSTFDYGTKQTKGFDYGTKQTDVQGEHSHPFNYTNTPTTENFPGSGAAMHAEATGKTASNRVLAAGAHAHNIYVGPHDHMVDIGPHSHTLSGTTTNTGSGNGFSVINQYVKLMGWYRTA